MASTSAVAVSVEGMQRQTSIERMNAARQHVSNLKPQQSWLKALHASRPADGRNDWRRCDPLFWALLVLLPGLLGLGLGLCYGEVCSCAIGFVPLWVLLSVVVVWPCVGCSKMEWCNRSFEDWDGAQGWEGCAISTVCLCLCLAATLAPSLVVALVEPAKDVTNVTNTA